MKKKSLLLKIVIPSAALTVGLLIGFGVSRVQAEKKETAFQNKIKEASRKIAFIQKKMSEEKTEATVFMEQKFQGDLATLRNENKSLAGQMGRSKEQMLKLEMKSRETDEAYVKAKKESDEAIAKNRKDIQEMELNIRDLDNKLKKVTAEKQAIQKELKKTAQDLDHSEANNARLSVIAEDLVKKYRDKGLGTVLMEKEPLTQIRKVELEQLVREYKEKIEQQQNQKK